MNPPNPFGSPQGGAFQVTNSTIKTGLFQSFGQQVPSNQPQPMGFFSSSGFGQPPALNQPRGNAVFGQGPSFGQPSNPPSSLPSQTPAFGQPAAGMGFASTSTPAFGQSGGSNQSPMFGQTPAFGQPSAFGHAPGFGQQTPGFGKQPPAYGEQTSGFGTSQMASGTATSLGQPQPLGFGQSMFGQSSSTSGTTNVFGATQTQSKGFGTEFRFKPANDVLFKPIFSASPEPGNPQTTSMSSSPFGGSDTQTKSSTISSSGAAGFSALTGEKSGSLGFSFSQPAAAPSISAQNSSLTTGKSSSPSNVQFTFSQPAAPSSTNTNVSTTQPTTPSSFSFSAKTLQPQSVPAFGVASTAQPSAFGDMKAKVDSGTDSKASGLEGMAETNVFARLGKSTKRKDDTATANPDPELAAEDEETAEVDAPRQPPKRPLIRTRGPPVGLFGRALSGLRRDVTPAATREARTTQQQTTELDKTEKDDSQSQGDHAAATQSAVPLLSRDVLPKDEESDPAAAPTTLIKTTTPMRRGVRRESSDSGLSPTDCTVLQCRNLRPLFNKKDILERHFSRFGKVSKILCRPAKNLAIVHFDDHVSAAKAKKKGKMMHKHELLLLWQRKKQSPGDKGGTPAADQEQAEGEIQEDVKSHSSPLRRPQLRAPVVGSMVNFSRSSPVKRSSIAKSLQFDTDQKESTSEAQSSERAVPSSLLPLIGQVAETAEDKYRLLEQRDKILRQGRPKRQDLDLSKVFVGTCSDMCPEKERYMRETRKQLSMFEVTPNTEMVDHTTAIKEYSRSSADQEEPLPHELRPLPVLSMTMDYLVTRIMDQGFDNYRDWYDFVWNRTRGIRKDITQQRLCCPHTVSLIEKCTRFHVHCAHHLCEEPLSAFDPKINNENMTKCLQSLKEMYEDLKSRNIYCPREAEFRQYNVLLKLNDGDILREVQQFRDEVRNSPEVKFAVQTFAALNSNNFVRFFKLVKGASYLASCLLHRYFNQVRAKALKTLMMAHTMGPRSSTVFPLEDIVRMLMFHDAEQAADAIQQYGLNVNDGLVELSRVAYQEPELPLSHKKSDFILDKKTMLIGEVVNGSSLPIPPQHTPICSFDSQNKFRGDGHLAEPTSNQFKDLAVKVEVKLPLASVGLLPQIVPTKRADAPASSLFSLPPATETGEPEESYGLAGPSGGQQLFLPIFQPEPVKPPSPPPKPQPAYSDEDINAEVESVIEEFVDAAVREVATAGTTYATEALAESSLQAESVVSEVLGQMLQEISADEFHLEQQRVAEEKRKLEEARRKQEHEAFLIDYGFSLCKDLIHEVLDETIKETATSEMQQALDDKARCVAKCTEQVCTSLVEETLNADISLLIEEILNVELQRIHKYIKRWRDVVAVRRQLKRQMRGFPASPCCVDPRFKLKALAPSAPTQASLEDLVRGMVNLGNAGTLALSSTRVLKMRRDAMHQMRVHYYYQQLLDKIVWSPLDLPALVMESIDSPPDRIFWKAVLLLPSDDESVASPADRILSDWLEVKLGGGKESKVSEEKLDGVLQNLCVSSTLQENGECSHKVHLSIKVSRGPLTEDGLSKMEECYDLQGTGALVLLLPALPIADPKHDEQDIPLLSALLQLKQLQQANTWHCPLPLVILVPGPDSGDSLKLEEALMLHKLVQEGLISEYIFVFIPETTSDPEGSKQLNHAMRWLVARAPPCFPLSCRTLVQLIEATLSQEFSPRVHAHRQERSCARLLPQDPGPVVRLYNAVLAHVADRVSSPELCRLSWPPGEFCLQDNREFVPHLGWNSPSHLAWLREAILSLQLPECEGLSATDSWSEQCSAIFRYASQIPATHRSQPLLMSRLENLLARVRVGLPAGAPVSMETSGIRGKRGKHVTPVHSQIPWDDVVVMCIDHKLKDWLIPTRPMCEDAVTEDGEILVYLPKESVKSFEPPEEWTEAVQQTHREKQEENTGATAAACITPTGPFPRQRLFQSFAEPVEAPAAPLDISHTATTEELLAHKVLQNLEEEKAESKRSMEQLQRWLDGDTLENWSTSLFLPSSTLLSMPATIMHRPAAKARHHAEDPEPVELFDKANWKKTSPLSMTKRLKELEQQILASQEEELACRLKLSGMLSIVDD